MLKKEKFLNIRQHEIDKDGKLLDHYQTPVLIRFCVLSSDPDSADPDKLTENAYIWSYGYDRKNHVNAKPAWTATDHGGPTEFDKVEAANIEGSPGSNEDDVFTW